jgi:hypothetical protein
MVMLTMKHQTLINWALVHFLYSFFLFVIVENTTKGNK